MALMGANIGYEMAEENPVTHFMEDKSTGKLREDVAYVFGKTDIFTANGLLAHAPVSPLR